MSTQLLLATRHRHHRRYLVAVCGLAVALVLGFCVSLMVGRAFYGAAEVIPVLLGEPVPGAAFTVGELRLPRSVLAVLGGIAFGLAGATFQTMLGNPLSSPDILGVSAGAGTAAVFAIVVLGANDTVTSVFALTGALAVAAVIFLLSTPRTTRSAAGGAGGFVGTRFILIGIGLSAMLQSATSYLLARSSEWDIQRGLQWISGSVNGARWEQILPLALACALLIPCLLLLAPALEVLRLGSDTALALGVPVKQVRVALIVLAVALLAFATAACGPVLFVAFMAGPIAARLVGPGRSVLIPAGLVGAALVLGADLIGQNLFAERYPVGVITGAVGAPYLIFLLIRMNRTEQA